ncbi:hypothetical protein L195_g064501, partial [Trifolium pratense]
ETKTRTVAEKFALGWCSDGGPGRGGGS